MTSILDSHTHQEQDVTIIQSLFFWVYSLIPSPHHLFERLVEAPQQFTTFSLAISTKNLSDGDGATKAESISLWT